MLPQHAMQWTVGKSGVGARILGFRLPNKKVGFNYSTSRVKAKRVQFNTWVTWTGQSDKLEVAKIVLNFLNG